MVYALSKASILVVDDMQPMLAIISSILKIFGFTNIHLAHDAEEGLELFRQHNPDIVLTDWLMEPFDGVELARRIRAETNSPNRFVPIIMMTGYSHRVRVEQARDAGITEFLVKPFRAKDLCKRIEQLIEKPRRFVDTGEFFGPDRRRRLLEYEGPIRRESDQFKEIAAMEEKSAAALLRGLKEKARQTGGRGDGSK